MLYAYIVIRCICKLAFEDQRFRNPGFRIHIIKGWEDHRMRNARLVTDLKARTTVTKAEAKVTTKLHGPNFLRKRGIGRIDAL
jgi:hypothetical protein